MRNVLIIFLTGILFSSLIATDIKFVAAETDNQRKFAPGTLLVKFNDNVSNHQKQGILIKNNAQISSDIEQIGVLVLSVPPNAIDEIETALNNNPSVKYVERDWLLEPIAIPDDPLFPKQWHLSKINADKAWDITKGDGSPIAILDSGIDETHPDLADKIQYGYNTLYDNYNISDNCGHGTMVAGVAAAITDNGIGVSGVAWNNPIIPIKISDASCIAYSSAVYKGIVYAADKGAIAANISYSYYSGEIFNDAAKYMLTKGGWVIIGSGNSGELINYEDNPYIISISATDSQDEVTSWSTFGPYVDFAAPGSGIYSTISGGSYKPVSGTSFSGPMTASAVALIHSADPSLTPEQIYTKLKNSSVDLGEPGRDYYSGWGRIDIEGAINSPTPSEGETYPIIDTTPPSIEIINPEDYSTIKGKTNISTIAFDEKGLSKVELFVDGELVKSFASSFDYEWNPKGLSGTHSLSAKATDLEGNQSEKSITILIEKGGNNNSGKGNGNGKK